MNEISKRLIDGDKLLLDMNEYPFSGDVKHFYNEIQSGKFDIPFDQREAARLREALERARNTMEDALSVGEARYKDYDESFCPWADLRNGVEEIGQVLSSHTEEPDAMDHFVDAMEKVAWKTAEDTGVRTGIMDKNGKEVLGGHHCEVYIDGESPNNGLGKAVVKWSQERECWMFDFYAGVEWGTNTQEAVTDFDTSYIEVITIPGINTEEDKGHD